MNLLEFPFENSCKKQPNGNMNIITPYRVVVVDVVVVVDGVVVTAVCSSVAVQVVYKICNGCKYMYRGKCKE